MSVPPPRTAVDGDQAFVVRLEAYSGPLDLLLHLIHDQEIEITDIPIAKIAGQFLEAIDVLGLNHAADYLDMAAQLLRIKIQMLLPRPFDDETWEDPRAELVRRLLEYEQVREVAGWFAGQAGQHAGRFARGWMPETPELPPPPITVNLDEVLWAVERVVEAMPQPILHRVVPRPLDVEGATRRLIALIDERQKLRLLDALGDRPTVADLLSVLIAVLELARLGRIRIAQRRTFGAVTIRRDPAHSAA